MSKVDFPSTIWSNLIASIEVKHIAEEYLIRHYWKPIFYYIKRYGNDDPENLTQEFLQQCLEKNFLGRLMAKEQKGSFRCYLKNALHYFLCNHSEWQQAKKRCGDFSHLPFSEAMEVELPENKSPGEIFNYMWAKDFMQSCYKILREKCKDQPFLVFHDFYVTKTRNYKQLMEHYTLSKKDVNNYLQRTKKMLEKIVTKELSQSVANAEELEEELIDLKRILSRGK